MKKFLFYVSFWLLSCTWGVIMTLIGAIAALALLITGHRPYHLGPNVYFIVGESWGGVNFGPFFIVSKNPSDHTRMHECGHGLQNILWGPLFPFVVAIPSAARYWYREYVWRTDRTRYWDLPPYDSVWFEGQATEWGEKVYLPFILNKNKVKKEG